MVAIRVVLGALIAILVVVLLVPAIVLMDLITGGSGLGLCSDGLGSCDTPFYTLVELMLGFAIVVFALGFGVTACLRALGRDRRTAIDA